MGSVDGGQDPIFQRSQPDQGTPKSAVLVWQFFLVPLLIVAGALAVFLLFGAFAGSEDSPEELLSTVLTGGDNEKRQAVHQLALAINQEYRRVRRGEDSETPPFYAERSFQTGMTRAFEAALDDGDAKMQELIAKTLGLIQAEDAIPLLVGVIFPDDPKARYDDDARRGAAQGLLLFDSRAAESGLVRAAGDPKDEQVRAIAQSGLAKLGLESMRDGVEESPALIRAVRQGLVDAHAGTRVNAAIALAIRGVRDDRGVMILLQSLSREGLTELGIHPDFQSQALRNACRAAAVLGVAELKELVENLTDATVEGDDLVRQTAREALTRWKAET